MTDQLGDGVDPNSLAGIDRAMMIDGSMETPQQYKDAAQELLDGSDTKQFGVTELAALAELLLRLFEFLSRHRAARQLIRHAADHPHGLAAMLVYRKIEQHLPDQLRRVPDLARGITKTSDTLLQRAGA